MTYKLLYRKQDVDWRKYTRRCNHIFISLKIWPESVYVHVCTFVHHYVYLSDMMIHFSHEYKSDLIIYFLNRSLKCISVEEECKYIQINKFKLLNFKIYLNSYPCFSAIFQHLSILWTHNNGIWNPYITCAYSISIIPNVG